MSDTVLVVYTLFVLVYWVFILLWLRVAGIRLVLAHSCRGFVACIYSALTRWVQIWRENKPRSHRL